MKTSIKKGIKIALITLGALLIVLIGLGIWISGGNKGAAAKSLPVVHGGPAYRIYEAIDSVSPLKLMHFVGQPQEINVSSSIVYGNTEAVVFAAQANKAAASRLADEIEKLGRKLTYIYLGHAHLDHGQGASILKQRFPEAKCIAAPKVAAIQNVRMEADDAMAIDRYGDNAAVPSVPFEAFDHDKIMLEGREIQLWHDYYGDVGIGHEDEPHTVAYIPDLKALLPNDICYYGGHMMTGGGTPHSLAEQRKQIKKWMQMDLEVVIPGHVPRGWTPHMTAEEVLKHSLQYLEAYETALRNSSSSDELIASMLKKYPKLEHKSALFLSARMHFGETHRLLFNPRLEKVMSWLPDATVKWLDKKMWESKKESMNL
ncbi:MBL fold metallo-hydrolase [Spongiimicrobium salis]|uniref:MBL fold metallo-hydrolase n=1 Tax=Spongiimicrobium salis TaxID=1667022 RepID=UPI00374DC76D